MFAPANRRNGRAARSLAAAATVVGLASACGGHSQTLAPQANPTPLECLVTLQAECCASNAQPRCIARFAAAEECSSWPTGETLAVFPTPCEGMTAVRAIQAPNSYASFYVYDSSGTLYAIGDNATSPDPQSRSIECGAGPSGWFVPAACANLWLGSSGSQPCLSGTAVPTSVCTR